MSRSLSTGENTGLQEAVTTTLWSQTMIAMYMQKKLRLVNKATMANRVGTKRRRLTSVIKVFSHHPQNDHGEQHERFPLGKRTPGDRGFRNHAPDLLEGQQPVAEK